MPIFEEHLRGQVVDGGRPMARAGDDGGVLVLSEEVEDVIPAGLAGLSSPMPPQDALQLPSTLGTAVRKMSSFFCRTGHLHRTCLVEPHRRHVTSPCGRLLAALSSLVHNRELPEVAGEGPSRAVGRRTSTTPGCVRSAQL